VTSLPPAQTIRFRSRIRHSLCLRLRGSAPACLGCGRNDSSLASGHLGKFKARCCGPCAGPIVITLPTQLNAVAVAPDGEIVTAGADGKVYVLSAAGEIKGEAEVGPAPIIALSISGDGKLVAAAGIRGSVAIIDRAARKLERTLVGPGLPVWSVAFFPDSPTLLTGGADRVIRRWDAQSGEPMGTVVMGSPAICSPAAPSIKVLSGACSISLIFPSAM
jgi:WD40 repeat protein